MAERENPTAEEFGTWVVPKDALIRFKPIGIEEGREEIYRRLATGRIVAAGSESWTADRKDHWVERVIIPALWWRENTHAGYQRSPLWSRAAIAFARNDSPRFRESTTYEFFGVRFEPEDVEAALRDVGLANRPYRGIFGTLVDGLGPSPQVPIAPSAEGAPVETTRPPRHAGGAPRKEWWDELWVEMARQLYEGVLIPKIQADIEKAMLDWAASQGHELSERTARDRARKLFRAIKTEGNN